MQEDKQLKDRCNQCPKTVEILGNRYILKDMRCEKCNKLLGKGMGKFEIKCPRCGHMNTNKKESVKSE
jgi:DNA-directed RNA polymerase subunit RPC12/RpoP